MIPYTHWTKEGYGGFSEAVKIAMGLVAGKSNDPGLQVLKEESQKVEISNTGKYCGRVNAVAIFEGEVCIGEIRVKGSGINGESDKYGVPYSRRCALEAVCQKKNIVITAR